MLCAVQHRLLLKNYLTSCNLVSIRCFAVGLCLSKSLLPLLPKRQYWTQKILKDNVIWEDNDALLCSLK